jgi:Flp pilus assembly protein TadD
MSENNQSGSSDTMSYEQHVEKIIVESFSKSVALEQLKVNLENTKNLVAKSLGRKEQTEILREYLSDFELGRVAMVQGQSNIAKKCYEKAIKTDPQNAMAWNNLGAVYAEQGNTDQYLESVKKATEIES